MGSILTEIALLFADSDLPIDFYISSMLLRITSRVSFFQGFPRRFSIIKRGFWILCDQFPQKSGFCFLFCLEFCFTILAIYKQISFLVGERRGGGEVGVVGTLLKLNFLTPSPPRPQKGPGGDSSRK